MTKSGKNSDSLELVLGKVVHVVPGDGPNSLVQEIIKSSILENKVIAIQNIDQTMERFCKKEGISFSHLGSNRKSILLDAYNLIRLVRKSNAKVIFLHSFYPSVLGVFLYVFNPKLKVVPVRHHNRVHLIANNKIPILLDKLVSRLTTHTVAVSNSVRLTLIEQGCAASKVSVIYNGLPKQNSSNTIRWQNISNDGVLKILCVGRLDWQKNYETTLKICQLLQDQKVNFELDIYGTGGEEHTRHLNEMVQLFGLQGYVNFQGFHENMNEVYASSHVLLHPAFDEACPLVIIEALLAGIPIVASSAGGTGEILKNRYSICEPTNANCFFQEIMKFNKSRILQTKYAEKLIPGALKEFDPKIMQMKYTHLARQLISS